MSGNQEVFTPASGWYLVLTEINAPKGTHRWEIEATNPQGRTSILYRRSRRKAVRLLKKRFGASIKQP